MWYEMSLVFDCEKRNGKYSTSVFDRGNEFSWKPLLEGFGNIFRYIYIYMLWKEI